MIRPWFNSQVCGLLIVIIHFLDCVSTVAISVSFRIFTCYRYSSRMGKYYPCERGRRIRRGFTFLGENCPHRLALPHRPCIMAVYGWPERFRRFSR